MRSITMSGLVLAGALAVGALAAIGGFTPGVTSAQAAPSASRFAGTYVGNDPGGWRSSWAVTISDGGRITSSYSYPNGSKGSINGRISDDGSYSLTVNVTIAAYRDRREHEYIPRWSGSYGSAGRMALDAAGNVVGTPTTGGSFVWLRQ